jgi:LIVCS family branched-chain amino acid:cation transporter
LTCACAHVDILTLIKESFIIGYETLDLLASLFFASIIISLLKKTVHNSNENTHSLAMIGLKAGLIGVSLLGFIYVGMGILGVYHGQPFENVDSGELFRSISFSILGLHGAAVISVAVLMACFSTAIALSVVVAEYLQHFIFRNKVSYIASLIITLISCIPLSTFGLGYVLKLTAGPITYIGYPVLIAITFCNIAYKVWGFTPIKTPVAITFVVTLISYFVR